MVRSRVLGLCALALGLMAIVASAAQAETGAHWNIINAKGELIQVNETNKLFAQLEIKEIEKNSATLAFTTKGGTKVGLLCTAGKFSEGGKLAASGGISLGRIQFTGCVTLLNGVVSPPCKPKTTGKALGELLSEKGQGLIVLDKVKLTVEGKEVIDTEDYVKITPDTGTLFASIELGEECSIGTLVKVEAKAAGEGLWIKDIGGNAGFQKEEVEHLIVESLNGLIALGQPAKIEGSALVRLIGVEHLGLKWGGTPA